MTISGNGLGSIFPRRTFPKVALVASPCPRARFWKRCCGSGVPTNADRFPDAGLQPSDISLGANFDKAGADGLFDIKLEWKDGANKLGPADPDHSFSKLLLVYDDGKSNIDASDFFFGSAPDKGSKFGPFDAVAHIRNIPTTSEDSGWIAAVP